MGACYLYDNIERSGSCKYSGKQCSAYISAYICHMVTIEFAVLHYKKHQSS